MIEVEETGSGLHVWDSGNNELFVQTKGWKQEEAIARIDRADRTVCGVAEELNFPADVFSIKDAETGEWETHGSCRGDLSLPPKNHLIQIHSSIVVYLKFSQKAQIYINVREDLRIIFPEDTKFFIGFRSRFRSPLDKIEIPPTPEGLATALTQTSRCFNTNSPDRSFPSLRDHPPRIETSSGITNKLDEKINHLNDISVRAPSNFEELFVISTLVHYLQANIELEDRENVKITIPKFGYSVELPSQPFLETQANRMLRRVFMLDCLVRDFGEYKTNLMERHLLDRIGLDGNDLYAMDPERRLIEYLNVDFEKIESELPKWHLSMHVDPICSTIESIPFLLDRLSAIYLPRTEIVTDSELLQSSLEGARRSTNSLNSGTYKQLKKPILDEADSHGWLSEDLPFDTFKASKESFEHRLSYQETADSDSISIVVVLNEHEMKDEFTEIYEIFQEDMDQSKIDLKIHRSIDTNSLRDLVEGSRIDFFHYIGHCETDGLRCPNGNLSFDSIQSSSVQTFFLNACGSLQEGLNLIKHGSVVGAVTLRPVLNEPAAKVGSTFARLIINGFSFAKGLELSRKQILMNKFYSVVGDGTHRITNGADPFPILIEVDQISNDYFKIISRISSPQIAGSAYQPKIEGKSQFRLTGNDMIDYISKEKLMSFFKNAESPAMFNGKIVWSDEAYQKLNNNEFI